MRFNDIATFVDETSVANKELINQGNYFTGFDFLSDINCTLVFFGREHKVKGGIPFSINMDERPIIRSFKIKEEGVKFTLYAGIVYGSGNNA